MNSPPCSLCPCSVLFNPALSPTDWYDESDLVATGLPPGFYHQNVSGEHTPPQGVADVRSSAGCSLKCMPNRL